MDVLGKNQRKRKGTIAFADAPNRYSRRATATGPEIQRLDFDAGLDQRTGDADLIAELHRARVYGQRARRGARHRGAIDNAHADAELVKPQRQPETGRTGANDENGTGSLTLRPDP